MSDHNPTTAAADPAQAGRIRIGDADVARLGFGAMRITGRGVWGPPSNRATAADLQREGKIRHIGLSNVDLDELRAAQSVATIVSVQNRFNLADRDGEDVLDACETEGLAFIPWYPLSAGRQAHGASRALSRIAAARAATPAQVSIAWLLARSPAILPIPGTCSTEHLEENVASAGLRLTDAERAELDAA